MDGSSRRIFDLRLPQRQIVDPYVKSWHDKFKDRGLFVIALHSPEFNHERVLKNVQHTSANTAFNIL